MNMPGSPICLSARECTGNRISRARQWNTSTWTFYEAAKLAKEAQVKELWLTHYSPSLVYPEEFLPKVREIFPAVSAGKDGKSITLLFEDEAERK